MEPGLLNVEMLLSAYSMGVFPMADPDLNNEIFWYSPEERAILPLDERFKVRKSLTKVIRQERFEVRYDTVFREVMEACSAPRKDDELTWISQEIIDIYCELFDLGFAHSVEVWQDNQLKGGLYGVSLGGVYCGESMFSKAPYASQVALYHLHQTIKQSDYSVLDIQFVNPHLLQFGAYEVKRDEYEMMIKDAVLETKTWNPYFYSAQD